MLSGGGSSGATLVGAAPAAADARHRARAGPAGRRARDDDPAGLPAVPPDARPGQRLPVRAVPRAGVPLRRQGRRRSSSGSAGSPTRSGQRLQRRLDEPTLWDAFLRVLADRALRSAPTRRSPPPCGSAAHDRSSYADVWALAEALLQHDELAAAWRARHVVMVERMIGTKTGHRRLVGRRVPPQPPRPALLPAALGAALGALSGRASRRRARYVSAADGHGRLVSNQRHNDVPGRRLMLRAHDAGRRREQRTRRADRQGGGLRRRPQGHAVACPGRRRPSCCGYFYRHVAAEDIARPQPRSTCTAPR